MLSKKGTHQSANYQTLTARMKINQIPYVIFSSHKSEFSFKLCITFQCHDAKFLWNFLAELFMLWTKRNHQSTNFETFACFNESSPNFSCQFWSHKVKHSVHWGINPSQKHHPPSFLPSAPLNLSKPTPF